MTSRDSILSSIRKAAAGARDLPPAVHGIQFDDPVGKFAEMLAAVGGRCARGNIEDLDVYRNAKRIVRCPDGLAGVNDPRDLAGADLAIVHGVFAVAENAAVWVPGENIGNHRVAFVIAEHLVLLVPENAIVHNMHEAYERAYTKPGQFGVFISGPSKTADVEQSLVIGAQGPRSCTVVLTPVE